MSLPKPPAPSMSTLAAVANSPLVDALYAQWKADPTSVERDWQTLLRGVRSGHLPALVRGGGPGPGPVQGGQPHLRLPQPGPPLGPARPPGQQSLLPSGPCPGGLRLCRPRTWTGSSTRATWAGPERAPLRDIIAILKDTYCRSVGVEYIHIQDVKHAPLAAGPHGAGAKPLRPDPGGEARDPPVPHRRRALRDLRRTAGTRARSASPSRAASPSSRPSTPSWRRRPTWAWRSSWWAWPTGAGSTSWPTSWTSPTPRSSPSSRRTSRPSPWAETAT